MANVRSLSGSWSGRKIKEYRQMRKLAFLFGLPALLQLSILLVSPSLGSVPSIMSYQGKLLDQYGQPVADGSYYMRFFLYNQATSGTLLWQEPASGNPAESVQVTGGVFSVLLGSVVALSSDYFTGSTWLEIEVDNTPLTPRIQIVTAGYAFHAQTLCLPFSTTIDDSNLSALSIVNSSGQAGYFGSTGDNGSKAVLEASNAGSASAFKSTNTGSGYAGEFTGKLKVTSTAEVGGFKLGVSPSNGYVLTSDSSGAGTWQAVPHQTLTQSTGEFNVKDYGAVGDGSTNDTSAINSAINAVPSSGGTVYFPPGTYLVSSLTFPTKAIAKFGAGAMLSISSGATVTVSSAVEAGLYQIFSGAGSANLWQNNNKEIYPQWWGAKADNSTDDTDALQKAMNAAAGKTLIISGGVGFKITNSITGVSDVVVRGNGTGCYIRDAEPAPTSDINVLKFDGKANFVLEHLYIKGANKNIGVSTGAGTGILIINSHNAIVSNCYVEYTTAEGILVYDSYGVKVVDNYVANGNGTNYSSDIALFATAGNETKDVIVRGNTCVSSNGSGVSATISTTGSIRNCTITDNYVCNKLRHGIYLYEGSSGYSPSKIVISNNQVKSCNWMGIYLNGDASQNVVTNNYIEDVCKNVSVSLPWGAISIAGTTASNYNVFSNNVINGFHGRSGIRVDKTNYTCISNNVLVGDGTAKMDGYDNAISLVNSSNASIDNNIIKLSGYEGDGICITSTGTTYYAGNRATNNQILSPSGIGIRAVYQRQLHISSNSISSPAQHGIYGDAIDDSLIEANIVKDVPANGSSIHLSDPCNGDAIKDNKLISAQTSGKGIYLDNAYASDCVIENNDLSTLSGLGNPDKLTNLGARTQIKNNKFALAALNSSFTCAAGASTTVNNPNVTATSRIVLMPTNASAGTLMNGASSLYLSARTSGTSFTVSTANGLNAAGTETFDYFIE